MRCLPLIVLLLLCGTAAQSGQKDHEQTNFGAEGDFEHPVQLPVDALQTLRTSNNPDDQLQRCAEQKGIKPADIPASWFAASEIRLSREHHYGLVLRGEQECLG